MHFWNRCPTETSCFALKSFSVHHVLSIILEVLDCAMRPDYRHCSTSVNDCSHLLLFVLLDYLLLLWDKSLYEHWAFLTWSVISCPTRSIFNLLSNQSLFFSMVSMPTMEKVLEVVMRILLILITNVLILLQVLVSIIVNGLQYMRSPKWRPLPKFLTDPNFGTHKYMYHEVSGCASLYVQHLLCFETSSFGTGHQYSLRRKWQSWPTFDASCSRVSRILVQLAPSDHWISEGLQVSRPL